MGPVREMAASLGNLSSMHIDDVPAITTTHFSEALEMVTPSVSPGDLVRYIDWNTLYGSYRRME